jgi:hypothetical protein
MFGWLKKKKKAEPVIVAPRETNDVATSVLLQSIVNSSRTTPELVVSDAPSSSDMGSYDSSSGDCGSGSGDCNIH